MNTGYKLGSIRPPAVRASRWVLLLAAAVIALGCLVTALSLPGGGRAALRTAAASSVAAGGYTVREYNGRIAVFAQGGTAPQQVLDVYVVSLPAADQQKLRRGITVKTHDELLALLENYSS